MRRIAIFGTGLIGRGWAIIFARAGHQAALYDPAPGAMDQALASIEASLGDLAHTGLITEAPAAVMARVRVCASLAEALEGAVYAQESAPEDAGIKRQAFLDMDALAAPGTVLGSSCSAIPGSVFLEDVPGRGRCLIAHPANPPYLMPVVELIPTPWTEAAATEACRALMDEVGQVPVLLKKEIAGFVMNRMQTAVINEAIHLVATGVMSPEDIDRTMRSSIGMRWSFMGPFETMDMNAPGGFKDYATRYGASYRAMGRDLRVTEDWDPDAIEAIEAARRAKVPKAEVAARQAWRDRRLMALLAHMREADRNIGE
jgi:3-hydroxyacyl-CoA dehydrogenase